MKLLTSFFSIYALSIVFSSSAMAKIDLVSLPDRSGVQLTIYNQDNITMVRDQRLLTLSKGLNELEFGWANTLIDPTSVDLTAPKHADKVKLVEVRYPPNTAGSAVWVVDSQVEGAIPVDIRFFTTNISWNAFYIGTLDKTESSMSLNGYVRVTNNSGEDYLYAETRVIVGDLNLTEEINMLANRASPYGRPNESTTFDSSHMDDQQLEKQSMIRALVRSAAAPQANRKSIIKTAVSEFFVYSIEGTEDIKNGWGKRLLSLSQEEIPVKNLYRYDAQRYGNNTHRLITLSNSKQHKLGEEPLPNGKVMIYKNNAVGSSSIIGATSTKYIPIGEDIELDMGKADDVIITPTLIQTYTENYQFDRKGNINGYDRLEKWQIEIENYRNVKSAVEFEQYIPSTFWEAVEKSISDEQLRKIGQHNMKLNITIAPNSKQVVTFIIRHYEGERQQAANSEKSGEKS